MLRYTAASKQCSCRNKNSNRDGDDGMNTLQRWLGWIAIGIGAIALVVALAGTRFGSQQMGRFESANLPQNSMQQGSVPQGGSSHGGRTVPGFGAQSGRGQQGQSNVPSQDGQRRGGRSGQGPQ